MNCKELNCEPCPFCSSGYNGRYGSSIIDKDENGIEMMCWSAYYYNYMSIYNKEKVKDFFITISYNEICTMYFMMVAQTYYPEYKDMADKILLLI
jgi:hypothetical protein